MTAYECASLVVSILSLLVAFYSVLSSNNAKAKSEEANRLSNDANRLSNDANRLSSEANRLSNEANRLANNANASAAASVEISIQSSINSTKEKIMDCTADMEGLVAKKNLNAEETRLLDMKQKRFNVAVENNLNSYESACAKYIDDKIDKVRFKKEYAAEIKNIVEDKNYKKYFDAVTSKYKAILKVYKEWFDLENNF